jgi:nucleotide-binding universal stress UspA family protein
MSEHTKTNDKIALLLREQTYEERMKATRFARRIDAEAVHAGDLDAWTVQPYKDLPNDADEAYEIGVRDGYEDAIQDLDLATGGDGEFKGSTVPGETIDVPAMKARIIERFAAPTVSESVTVASGVREVLDDLQQAEHEYREIHDRHGDGSQAAGRAWDLLRRAGDKARAALSASPVTDGVREALTPVMAAFGASEYAGYKYPGEDQQRERAAFCEGAAFVVASPTASQPASEGKPDLELIEATARKINPGRSEDHIKSVALDALSIIRALSASHAVKER